MEPEGASVSQLDVELEQQFLGALIADNSRIDKAQDVISESDIADPLHSRILGHIYRLHEEGTNISPITLHVLMKDDPGLITVGGGSYLAALNAAAPSLPNIISLSKAIKTQRQRQALARLGETIAVRAGDSESGPVQDQIREAEKELYALAEKSTYGSRLTDFSASVEVAMKKAEEAQNNGGQLTGIPTGFKDLDRMIGGLNSPDLLILAGRPGMGKTALATNIAFHAAISGHPVLFFSLEMSHDQLTQRILSERSGIEMWRIKTGQMRAPEWDDYVTKGQELSSVPLFIDDTGGLTLPQVAARARRAKREHKIELCVVDYLQLMSGTRKDGNRILEVTEITKGLKSLAKELDIPMLVLSQLSRSVDGREDKRPVLSDLRESGSIEQDADIVAFVYRHEYYVKSREPEPADPAYVKWQETMERCHGKADVIVEKHRHGATGPIHLGFDGRFTRFFDLEV